MTADMAARLRSGESPQSSREGAGQPILQVEADIAAPDGMHAARDVLLRWLEGRVDGGLPAAAWQGGAFSLATQEGRTAEVVSRADPPLWAALLTEPTATPDSPRWTAEASVSVAGDRARLAVRLGCTSPVGESVPAVPGFIRTLMRDVGLQRCGRALAAVPADVDSEEALDDLVTLIEDHRRDLPVIVISAAGPHADWPLDAEGLARRLAGLAWVYRVPFQIAFGLSDAFGKRWSVFQGATRLYRPGFNRDTQTPFDHPLLLPPRPLEPQDDGAGEDFLCREVVRTSIEAPGIYRRLPRFEAQAAACMPAAPPPRSAQDEIAQALDQTAELEKMARAAQQELDETRRLNVGLQARIEALEDAARTGEPDTAAPDTAARPAKYQDLPQWVEATFPDRLMLSAKAHRAAKTSVYRDIGTVCDALELLARDYVDMRRNGGRDQFEHGLKTLRLKDEAVAANPDRLRKDPQYWCRHEGRPVFVDRHLKKGNSREPRECMRIYYAWDEESRKVVVGHLTTHLASEIS